MISLRNIARFFVAALVFLSIPNDLWKSDREVVFSPGYLLGSDINSLIMLDTRLFSNQSRDIGFNYDLFDCFAKDCRINGNIETRPVDDECWEELLSGRYNLIAFDSRTPVPEKYADEIICSVPLRDSLMWATTGRMPALIDYVNIFFDRVKGDGTFRDLVYRHYRSYRIDSYLENDLKIGALSPYDDVIRKYGGYTGVDWRLLSAIVYQESRYNMATISNRSAKGLMQIKESTAAHYGIYDLHNPELNVKAGTLHFAHLVEVYSADDMEPEEAVKFALAAYNAGEARIEECRHTADSLGLNRNKWSDVVEAIQTMETFDGKEQTRKYVESVLARFAEYQRIID